ncbi:hypothetical protein [Methanimicrococcus blatticola]|uniref:hypothetical protein n=1 Tax=Methanimicrococcus blatticola TaxID=91560 RepID=UPI00105BC044|nr:hypothetical protein [Methanimicrococcus blatticola]MBZ3936372.1 hypothetical protein [Methanimicrococcus blatticola]MCC2509534.1 hypothetical protein [Methanimicrococcus blatticola]
MFQFIFKKRPRYFLILKQPRRFENQKTDTVAAHSVSALSKQQHSCYPFHLGTVKTQHSCYPFRLGTV